MRQSLLEPARFRDLDGLAERPHKRHHSAISRQRGRRLAGRRCGQAAITHLARVTKQQRRKLGMQPCFDFRDHLGSDLFKASRDPDSLHDLLQNPLRVVLLTKEAAIERLKPRLAL